MPDPAQARGKLVAKMRVAVRIRPPLPREVSRDTGKFLSCVGLGPDTDKGQTLFINSAAQPVLVTSAQAAPAEGSISRYTFDKIFAPNVGQEPVYSYTMEPLVQVLVTLASDWSLLCHVTSTLTPDWCRPCWRATTAPCWPTGRPGAGRLTPSWARARGTER